MKRLLKEHFSDARFRFQVPLRHYIVDFASHRLRVVIEIDGGQHSVERDAQRNADIEAEGYMILRFWNTDVLNNGEGCIFRLRQLVDGAHPNPAATRRPSGSKSPHPSPIKGEGGK